MMVPTERVSCLVCGVSAANRTESSGFDYEYETTEQPFTFVRCSACGHCYLDPRPTIDAASQIYPETYYSRTDDHSGDSSRWLGRIKDFVTIQRIRPLLRQLDSGAAALDVGAGDGALLLAMRRARPDLRLIAQDWSFTLTQKRRLEAERIEIIEGPVEAVTLPDRVIDLAIMNQVIEHLWDARQGLRKIHGAMRPGGCLSIATPNLGGYDRRLFADYWGGYYMPRHLNLFSVTSLARLLRDEGFDVIDMRQLVAPLVWVRNCQYFCKARQWGLHRVFTDHNLPALLLFAVMDRVAILLGGETSNLQCIARSPRDLT